MYEGAGVATQATSEVSAPQPCGFLHAFGRAINDSTRREAVRNKIPTIQFSRKSAKNHCLNSQDLHVSSEKELLFYGKGVVPCTAELMMYKITLTSQSPTVAPANSEEKRDSKQAVGDQKTT